MADAKITVELEARIDREFKDLNQRFDDLSSSAQKSESGFLGFNSAGVAAAAVVGGMTVAVKSMVDAAIQIENLETQFIAFTGSAESAAKQVERIAEFSSQTPFQLEDLANANRSLLAFGVSAEESFVRMKQLGEAAAATGANIGDLAQIFGQIQAAGKLTGERFLQLAERGINVGGALAKSLGVAENQLEDLRKAGKITAEDFNKAFASMTDEGGQFSGSMERMSKTVSGSISTLKDNFFLLTATLGQQVAPAVSFVIDKLNNAAKVANLFLKELNPAPLKGLDAQLKETSDKLQQYGNELLRLKAEGPGFFESQKSYDAKLKVTQQIVDNLKAKTQELIKERQREAQLTTAADISSGGGGADPVGEKTEENKKLLEEQKKYTDQLQALSLEAAANDKIIRESENEAIKENLEIRNQEVLEKIQERQIALLESQGAYEEASLLRAQNAVDKERAIKDKQLEDQKRKNEKARQDEFKLDVLNERAKAKWERQTWTQRAQTTQEGLQALADLQYVNNKQAFEVGKAAAIAQTLISIPEAAQKAYSSLAGIPVVGPGLGIAAAAAAIVAGTARVNQIRSAKFTKYAEGGIVTGGVPGKDSVPALLTPGEIVAPQKSFADLMSGFGGSGSNELLEKILAKLDDQLNVLVRISDNTAGRQSASSSSADTNFSAGESVTSSGLSSSSSAADEDRKTLADYDAYWGHYFDYLESKGKKVSKKLTVDQYFDNAFKYGDENGLHPKYTDPNWSSNQGLQQDNFTPIGQSNVSTR